MSEAIKHECGLAFIRLRKPLSFYHRKYGTAFYGLNKLYLLMEKQHNRGQDGAGVATLKLNVEPGHQFMHRLRISGNGAIAKIFADIQAEVAEMEVAYPDIRQYPGLMKGYLRFMGEVMLGHLRYGTQGRNDVAFCHPFIKSHINPARTLTMAGNFNLANAKEIFASLPQPGDLSMQESDLGAIIEAVHYHLNKADEANPSALDLAGVLRDATHNFDGGYVCGGLIGNGDSFVLRDPHGIRPAYYYVDDEIVVAASERPAIMTAFNLELDQVQELQPGTALIVKAKGEVSNPQILEPREQAACSFERIYFSRGSDADIYKERKQLGRNLAENVLEAIDYNLKDTIVSYIPNTAETAFYGLIKGMEAWLNEKKLQRIREGQGIMTDAEMLELIGRRVRIEKVVLKDVKMRTFITEDASRAEMVQHVYDITYGTVRPGIDSLVVIDDSIVRGTTLRESIIRMLDRLGPKRIVIVSSSPQIRYPDCYGIDMSRMGDFIAFQAAIELLRDKEKTHILDEVYQQCKAAEAAGELSSENFVKQVYAPFAYQEISNKIAFMLRTESVNAWIDVIYQTLEGLHEACPNNSGDWYFTGDYPTVGGNGVANKAFMNWMEGAVGRGY